MKVPVNKFIRTNAEKEAVVAAFSQLTLKQKIGQLIYPGIKAEYLSADSAEMSYYRSLVKEWGIGGFVLFAGTVFDYAHFINEMQGIADIPLLFGADFERGLWMRIPHATPFPHQMGIASCNDPALAKNIAFTIGTEAKSIGIYQNFSPVADLITRYENPIVNIRGFAESPQTAAEYCQAFVVGYRKAGILSCLKHFPGHGDTIADSHKELPEIKVDKQLLFKRELIPFIAGIKAGADCIMPGHLIVPSLTKTSSYPATLSKDIITGFLRNELKFKGLAVTDAMAMQAITDNFSVAEAAVLAVNAGIDQILMPVHPEITMNAIYEGVKTGRVFPETIDLAVLRVLSAKKFLGWNNLRNINFEKIRSTVGSKAHYKISFDASIKSINIQNPKKYSTTLAEKNSAHLLIADAPVITNERQFSEELASVFAFNTIEVSTEVPEKELTTIFEKIQGKQHIIISIFLRVRAFRGNMQLPEKIIRLVETLLSLPCKKILISFGSPYLNMNIPKSVTVLYCYSDSPLTQRAAVRKLASITKVKRG